MVEAWDGWCPTTDAKKNIKFVVPKEGSDLWVDTMVILKSSKNKEAAHALINYILDPRSTAGSRRTSSTRCPTRPPWTPATRVLEALPPLGMTPAELLTGESLVDLGEASTSTPASSTEVTAQQ